MCETNYKKYITVLTDDFIIEELTVWITYTPFGRYASSEYEVEVDINWDEFSYRQGIVPVVLSALERYITQYVLECVNSDTFTPDVDLGVLDLQTALAQGKTSNRIVELCLDNLVIVDEQISKLKYLIDMTGYNYWYQLYRLATCSLHDNSSVYEVNAVRTLQTLVSLQTIDDEDIVSKSEYDETKVALLQLLNKRVRALLN
jgi:hypothetical protein